MQQTRFAQNKQRQSQSSAVVCFVGIDKAVEVSHTARILMINFVQSKESIIDGNEKD
jgi:hypothetical protein